MCTFFRFDLLKLTSALHRQDNTFVKKLTPLGRKHRLVTTLRTLRAISAEHRFAFVPNLVPRIRLCHLSSRTDANTVLSLPYAYARLYQQSTLSYLSPISFPESAFPLSGGTGNGGLRSQWTKVTSILRIKWTCPVYLFIYLFIYLDFILWGLARNSRG